MAGPVATKPTVCDNHEARGDAIYEINTPLARSFRKAAALWSHNTVDGQLELFTLTICQKLAYLGLIRATAFLDIPCRPFASPASSQSS